MPGFHEGRSPRNKGLRYPADPPTVEEIIAVMCAAGDSAERGASASADRHPFATRPGMATAPGARHRATNAGSRIRRARSSGASGNLTAMVDDDAIIAAVTDPDGHQVVLLARIWEQKITVDHPELARHRQAVMETVARPDQVEVDALPARTRFHRRGAGPSRWLLAVVSYEQQPGRIITALANRKDPKQWTS
jgi:hypothetical protein